MQVKNFLILRNETGSIWPKIRNSRVCFLVEKQEISSLKFNSKNSIKNDYDILILAVDHDEFINKGYSEIESFIKDGGIFFWI